MGRSRFRWLEDEENDVRELKIKRWRLKTNDGEEWALDLTRTCKKGSSAILLYLIAKG